MKPARFSFPHGLDETSPLFLSPWSGCNQPVLILVFVLLFDAGANPVKLVGTQAACENGKLIMRAETIPLLHHLRILARIRKRERAMHRQRHQPLHPMHRHRHQPLHLQRMKLLSLLRRIALSS
jgi:hypothetical protein